MHHKHHRQEYRQHDRHAGTNRDSRLELRSLGDEFIVRADEAAKSVPDGMMRDLAIPILIPICGWASDRADPLLDRIGRRALKADWADSVMP